MQIEAKNVSFRYSDNQPWILQDVSLKVEEGERVGLVGPSGYGKSTLVKIMSGYLKPTKGEVLLDGKPLPCSILWVCGRKINYLIKEQEGIFINAVSALLKYT